MPGPHEVSSELAIALPPGRRLHRSFVDAATGYRVILHFADGQTEGVPHVLLVDPRTGEAVPIERRAAEIEDDEVVRLDETNGLRLVSRRTIDRSTGQELFDDVVSDIATGAVVRRATSIALGPEGFVHDPIADYLASREAAQQLEAFWRDEYPQWSFDRRVAYWHRSFRSSMRRQGEWGLDEFAAFTPEALAIWRARDPDFDRVLDAVLAELESGDAAAIDVGLGRAKPTAPKSKRRRGAPRARRPRK